MDHTAAGLGLRQITTHAGLAHSSFYNYYPDIPALLEDLRELLGGTHAVAMSGLVDGSEDPVVRFARVTRQTLRIVAGQPGFGRLVFDVGLPGDLLTGELRLRLKFDIATGVAQGAFKVLDVTLTESAICGAINGLALDLHRGHIAGDQIDAATALLMTQLGVSAEDAQRLAHERLTFPPMPSLPMRWLALPVLRPRAEDLA